MRIRCINKATFGAISTERAGEIPEAQRDTGDDQEDPGVGGVANQSIGPGVDHTVVGCDHDVDSEEASEVDDGPPTQQQAKKQ